VLKFWRKQATKKQTDFKKNKKLGQEFEEALKQKISLETLTSESNDVIKGLVSISVNKNSLVFLAGRSHAKCE